MAIVQMLVFVLCSSGCNTRDVGVSPVRDATDGAIKTAGIIRSHVYSVDLGILPPGAQIDHVFTLVNADTAAWRLESLETSCPCTHVRCGWSKIESGGRQQVTMLSKAGSKASNISRRVLFHSSDPTQPPFLIEVTGVVRPPAYVSTSTIELSVPRNGHSQTAWFAVENYGDVDWDDINAISDQTWIDVTTIRRNVSGRGTLPRQAWQVSIFALPTNLESGLHVGRICIQSGNAPIHEIACVWIHLQVYDELTVNPSALALASHSSDSSKDLVIERHGDLSLSADGVNARIVGPLSDHITIATRQAGTSAVELTLTLCDYRQVIADAQYEKSTLVLTTFPDSRQTIRVPIVAKLQQ